MHAETSTATCHCGCGRDPGVYARTGPRRGSVAGQPRKFCHGHGKLAAPPETAPAERRCTKCTIVKPLDEFRKCKRAAWGRDRTCKQCAAAWVRDYYRRHPRKKVAVELKKEYGLSIEEYDDMLAAQDGVCAICRNGEASKSNRGHRRRRLTVDHDHETGQVRGLLCSGCNLALGGFRDSPDLLLAAASYLASAYAYA